jgi:hypothetical protein
LPKITPASHQAHQQHTFTDENDGAVKTSEKPKDALDWCIVLLGEASFVAQDQNLILTRRKSRWLSVSRIARLKTDEHVVQVSLPTNALEVLPPQTKSWRVVHVGL